MYSLNNAKRLVQHQVLVKLFCSPLTKTLGCAFTNTTASGLLPGLTKLFLKKVACHSFSLVCNQTVFKWFSLSVGQLTFISSDVSSSASLSPLQASQ